MKAVVNSTPVISLAILEQLDLLKSLFDEVIIPQAVYDEVVTGGGSKPGSKELSDKDWFKIEESRLYFTLKSFPVPLSTDGFFPAVFP